MDSWRPFRIKIFPYIAAFFAGREVWSILRWMMGKSHRLLGLNVFFLGLALLFFIWWRMDLADRKHLEEQDEMALADPKHLINSDVGWKFNHGYRRMLVICLLIMAAGTYITGFQVLYWGFVFWGTAFVLAAAVIEIVY